MTQKPYEECAYAKEFLVLIVVLAWSYKGLLLHMGTDGEPTNQNVRLREAQVAFPWPV